MASSSSPSRSSRSLFSSPPPVASQPRDPNAPPRNPYNDPDSPPPQEESEETYYEQVSQKRRQAESKRNQSLLHGLALKPHITSLLESNDVAPLLNYIHQFIQTKNSTKRRILDSLSYHYPNSLSLKLSNLLSLNPPLHIRNEAVLLLQQTLGVSQKNNYRRIRCDMFPQLKSYILDSFKIELEEPLLRPLAEAIGVLASRVYNFPIGGWLELHEYTLSCVSLNSNDDDSVLKQRKGLMLLVELLEDTSEHEEFWKNHYGALFENLVARMLDETGNESIQALAFDSLYKMLEISLTLEEYEVGASILLIVLDFIDRHSNEEIVLRRVEDLADFFFKDFDQVLNGKEGNVFQAMLRVAEKNGASKELRCAAVQVLEILNEDRWYIMEGVMNEISDVDAQRVIKVSMDMMFESDVQCFEFGKTLLNWLLLKGDESSVFRMLVEFLKTSYADSKDLKKRHARMIVVAGFADENMSSDDPVLATEIIKMIADEINHIIRITIESGRALEAGTSEGGSEYLPDKEIIQSSEFLISSLTEALEDRLLPNAEELFSTIAQLWGNDFPDRVKAIAFSLFNIIGPHFPDKLQMYHDIYTCELLKTRDECLHTQLETARGIGICAKYGGQNFKKIVDVAISKLNSLIEHGHSIKGEESRDGAMMSDMAVSALGTICEFHCQNIDGPEVIRNWLNFLPLTNDLSLAKIVHGQLSEMLKRKDADILGPNKENLPKIISILTAICLRSDELATEETFSEIVNFLGNQGDEL